MAVYKMLELVGTSDQNFSDAVERTLRKIGRTEKVRWFHVTQWRGSCATDGAILYQVHVEVGVATEPALE